MSDPRFEHVGERSDHLIEECAELIRAIIKANRFGWENGLAVFTNTRRVLEEMADVQKRIRELSFLIETTTPQERSAWK